MKIFFRNATIIDEQKVMSVIEEGRAYLREQGLDQWQNGYPDVQTIRADIETGMSYIAEVDAQVVATTCLSFAGEPAYDAIDGKWLTEGEFLVVHRLATRQTVRRKSVAKKLLHYAETVAQSKKINSIKIDTHPENIPMRRLLEAMGYVRCGIVQFEGDRIAYEKILISL